MPLFDRVPRFDPRSLDYPIRALLPSTTHRSYTWACVACLNQGAEGACVGHAWAHENAARPKERPTTQQMAFDLYHEAQTLDSWPGENYPGTSVLAGAKAMKARGLIREYRWAFGLDDVLAAVSRHGPAVLGLDWWSGMMRTDREGWIHRAGSVQGGHAILCRGVSVKRRAVMLRNSWGPGWGINGDCWLSFDDLGALLADNGEACVPVVR